MEPRGKVLWVLLGILALAPRLLEVVGEPAYLHPDALHQGLEPAFRLVHGFGQETWEWREGLRSWLWPGVLALPFWLVDAAGLSGPGHGMGLAVGMARGLVAIIDVAGVMLAARLVAHAAGRWAAMATVFVLSIHPAQVVMGAQPLIDVPAAACLMWACERAFATSRVDERRGTWLGIALGLTLVLRIQLAPAVLLLPVALAWRARPARRVWLRVGIGVVAIVMAGGILDWATWGSPFHSTLAYLRFNLDAGQTEMGVMPADRYWAHLWLSMDVVAPLLLGLGLVGAVRRPALGIVILAIVVPHQLVPYKVWRFLYPAQTLLFALAVIGAADLVARAGRRGRRWGQVAAALLGSWTLVGSIRASVSDRLWETTWLFNQGGEQAVVLSRGLNLAYLELGEREQLTRVVQTVLPRNAAPGLALIGHDVSIVHPLGADVSLGPIAGTDLWIVRESAGNGPLDPRLREWRDLESGVAIYRPPVGPFAP